MSGHWVSLQGFYNVLFRAGDAGGSGEPNLPVMSGVLEAEALSSFQGIPGRASLERQHQELGESPQTFSPRKASQRR